MIPRSMLLELAFVCQLDADAIADADSYAWPPKVMTEDELRECNRLTVLSRRIAYRAQSMPEVGA